MPKPKKNEKKSDYISRCIPIVKGEGKTQDQAAGKCYGMWETYSKEKKSSSAKVAKCGNPECKCKNCKCKPGCKCDSCRGVVIDAYNLGKKKIAKEKIRGGLADGKPDSKYDRKELEMGIKVEMEHTDDPSKAKEIAKDHLEECPDYYTRLNKMESECEKKSYNLKNIKQADVFSDDTIPQRSGYSIDTKMAPQLGPVEIINNNTSQQSKNLSDSESLYSFVQQESEVFDNIANQALVSLSNMPATQERLKTIIEFFRKEVLERSINQAYQFFLGETVLTAQTGSGTTIQLFPREVQDLLKRMMYIAKRLGYDAQKVSNIFSTLFKTYNQELKYYDGKGNFRMQNVYNLNKIRKNAAEYQGKNVELDKPMKGDVKKFKVYVKNDKGNVVKVNFGDPNMEIKRDDPERRKNFRARHNCDNPGPKTKARYWSCKMWDDKPVSEIVSYNLNKMRKKSDFFSGDDPHITPDQYEKFARELLSNFNQVNIAKEDALDIARELPFGWISHDVSLLRKLNEQEFNNLKDFVFKYIDKNYNPETALTARIFNLNRLNKKAKGKKGRCWDGYEPVPGKKPYSKDSCKKKDKKSSKK